MSSYAPIWSSSATAKKLLIFGVSSNQHLNLRQWDPKSQDKHPSAPTDTTDLPDGIIVVSSNIVSLVYNEWTRVYGIITKKSKEGTNVKAVYMLSPVPEKMPGTDIITPSNSLAGVVDSAGSGYLYYLDSEKNVTEFNLGGGNDPKPIKTIALMDNTAIAACVGEDGHRYIAYQLADNQLQVYDRDNGSTLPDLESTQTSAQALTPLALVQYNKDGKHYLDLYYQRTKDGYLLRSRKIGTKDHWAERVLKDAGTLSQSTTISAIWDAEKQQVVLSFKLFKGDVVCVRDTWPDQE